MLPETIGSSTGLYFACLWHQQLVCLLGALDQALVHHQHGTDRLQMHVFHANRGRHAMIVVVGVVSSVVAINVISTMTATIQVTRVGVTTATPAIATTLQPRPPRKPPR